MMRTGRFLASIPILLGLLASASPDVTAGYTFTTLASFTGDNGSDPYGGVTLDAKGNIYGASAYGGPVGSGTVYEVAAGSNAITTLGNLGYPAGNTALGAVAVDAQGNVYGTTEYGGAGGYGTVYKVAAGSGTVTTIASFSYANGANPFGALKVDAQGNLYGTTIGGGTGGGTVFSIAAGSGTINTVASLGGAAGSGIAAGVTFDSKGNIYGTTENGGTGGGGTVFRVAAGSSTATALANFDPNTTGNFLHGGVTLDAQGNIYGVAAHGGVNGYGTVFEILAGTNTLVTLASFNDTNGSTPFGTLVVDAQGDLFGTTSGGGLNGEGTIFEVVAGSSTITTLVNFTDSFVEAGLTMDARGNLFGSTGGGGATGNGSIFELVNNNAASVPEPASLLAIGQAGMLIGVALLARARRQRASAL